MSDPTNTLPHSDVRARPESRQPLNPVCGTCDMEPVEIMGDVCDVCKWDSAMENEAWLGGEWD